MEALFLVTLLAVVAMAGGLMRHLAGKAVPLHAKAGVMLGWTTSLMIVAVLPLDVYTAAADEVEPPRFVGVLWAVSYWMTQVLCYLVIPFHQVYADAGDFTVKAKAATSLRENLTFYGITSAVGLVGLVAVLLSGKLDASAIPGLCIGLSNAFGLFAGIVLMAYGLVEVPRSVWRDADATEHERRVAKRVANLAADLEVATKELRRSLCVVRAIDERTSSRDETRPMLEAIARDVEEILPRRPAASPEDEAGLAEDDLEVEDAASLGALRRRCRRACEAYSRVKAQYTRVRNAAKRAASASATRRSASATGSDWVGTVRPWAVRLAAVVLATLSVSIVLAEATMVTKRNPDLSLFSVIVHSAVASGSGEFVVQLLVLVPLAYICYCTNFTLFHLAAFSFYHVVPGHTDAYSLLMSAALMCRFSAPLSFNFLNLIHVEGKTVFAHEMSSMSHLPLLGTRGFQLIFPIALLVFVICVLLNVHKRFQQFSDDDNGGDGDYDRPGAGAGIALESAGLLAAEGTSDADDDAMLRHEAEWSEEPLLRTRDARYRRERERRSLGDRTAGARRDRRGGASRV